MLSQPMVDDTPALWIHDFATGQSEKTIEIPTFPSGIAWSNDDEKLAYTINFGPRIGNLWQLDLDNGEAEKIGKTLSSSISAPSWSGNDKVIAFTTLTPYSDLYREGINGLLFRSTDGSKTWPSNAADHLSFGMRGNDGPQWSPDGSRLAFIAKGFLWLASVDNRGQFVSEPVQITNELSDSPQLEE